MVRADSAAVRVMGRFLRSALWLQSGPADHEDFERLCKAARLKLSVQECDVLEAILRIREEFSRSVESIEVQDYGVGVGSFLGRKPQNRRSISSIHKSSSIPHHWGVFLFRIVRMLNPMSVLELGSNLGISGAYLRTALDLNGGNNLLVTIEGDPTLSAKARTTLNAVSEGAAVVLTGRFQDQLRPALEKCGRVDLAFLDGHHDYDATIRYFDTIRPFLAPNACVIFDDVYLWSRPVRNAWKEIAARNPSAIAVDFAKLGILLFQEGEIS